MNRHGSVVLMFALLASCSSPRGNGSSGPACTAGSTEACSCESGASGTRTCQDDGLFGACACAGDDAMVSMDAADAVVTNDLPRPMDTTLTCSAPRLDCDNNPATGCEADTASDARHCGRCNNACPAGRSCVSGACACGAGSTACSGACVNTQSDTANCGGCGTRCNSGETCSAGRCTPPAGMCPSSCRAESDCAPCRTAGDPGNYCCISGLCLYMTGACMPAGVEPGPTGSEPPPDGSLD